MDTNTNGADNNLRPEQQAQATVINNSTPAAPKQKPKIPLLTRLFPFGVSGLILLTVGLVAGLIISMGAIKNTSKETNIVKSIADSDVVTNWEFGLTGKVVANKDNKITLVSNFEGFNKQTVTFEVTDETLIAANTDAEGGQPISVDEIQVGDIVEAQARVKDKKIIAIIVVVTTKKAS